MFLLIGFGLLLISCNNPDNTTSSKENVSNTTTTNSDKTSTTSTPSSNTTTTINIFSGFQSNYNKIIIIIIMRYTCLYNISIICFYK